MKAVILAMTIGLVAAQSAFAQDARIRSVRVSAPDVAVTAKFYQDAFGLKEVRRIDRDGALFEIIMNYGETVEEASASKAPRLVIILAQPGAPAPSVSNLIFGVKDIEAVVARAEISGGALSRAVTTSAASGARYGFVKDPAGNEVELIQE